MIYSFYLDKISYILSILNKANLNLHGTIAFESIIIHYERVKNILLTNVSYSFRRKNRTKGRRMIINMHSPRVNPHPEPLLLDLVRIFLVTVAFPEISYQLGRAE